MALDQKERKLFFIVYLRGIACIIVVWSHYVCMFTRTGVNVIFPYILPKTQEAPLWLDALACAPERYGLNMGSIGVSIFFLITGFLTAYSLMSRKENVLNFMLGKILRIYPTYIVGVLLLYFSGIVYTSWAGTQQPNASSFLIQATLLRDWLWWPSTDGIGWTLEVQLKMYVFLYVLYRLALLDKPRKLCLLAFIFCTFVILMQPVRDAYLQTWVRGYTLLYVLSFNLIFCVYALIGVVFANLYLTHWNWQTSCVVMAILTLLLSLSFAPAGISNLSSYMLGAAIFAAAYLVQNSCIVPKWIAFISKISFSIYIVHGVNGYYLLSFLDAKQIHPVLAVLLTTACTFVVAYLLHIWVEKPFEHLAQKLKRTNLNLHSDTPPTN